MTNVTLDPIRRTVLGIGLMLSPSTMLTGNVELIGPAVTLSDSGAERDPNRIALARLHYRKRQPVIAAFQDAIDRHLNYAKAETLQKLERHLQIKRRTPNAGVAADMIFDLTRFSDGLLVALRNESADALQTAGQEFYDEIGRDDPWSMPAPDALNFLAQRENLLSGIPTEIWTQIRDEIAAGLEAGDSISEISKRINAAFDAINTGRGKTIASTETSVAYGFAREKAMQKAGVQFKSWLTSHLPSVREAHKLAEEDPANQRTPTDQAFRVGGEFLMYPGDPNGSPENVINCHCVALATQ